MNIIHQVDKILNMPYIQIQEIQQTIFEIFTSVFSMLRTRTVTAILKANE